MRLQVDILRRRKGEDVSYLQSFLYEADTENETVADMLRALNAQTPLYDIDKREALPVRFECSCLQRRCGACAMVIDGVPQLACDVRLSSCKKKVRLEPLHKFPVVEDLLTDRSVMMRQLSSMRIYPEGEVCSEGSSEADVYEASRCLQCGCCLEVCPDFMPEGSFYGMAAAIPASRLLTMLSDDDPQSGKLAGVYRKNIYEGCGKSLACRNICPAGIDIDRLLVNSNAVAIWKRRNKNKSKKGDYKL